MKAVLSIGMLAGLLCTAVVAVAAEPETALEPAVRTSSAAQAPAPAPATPAVPATKAAPVTPAGATRTAASKDKPALDRIELDTTQITGNRELPNVMYVVPWKKPDLGEFAGRPPKSLLDELLAPVDREVFQRQNRYFAALQPDAAAQPPGPAGAPASGDEK
jgi:hypothetical protein